MSPEADRRDDVQRLAMSKALAGYTLGRWIWVGIPSLKLTYGSEIRRSPVDMVNIPLFTGFYTSQVVSRISEPSTVAPENKVSQKERIVS